MLYIETKRIQFFWLITLVILMACSDNDDNQRVDEQLAAEMNSRFGLKVNNIPIGYSEYFKDYVAAVYKNDQLYALYLDKSGTIDSRITQPLLPHGIQDVLVVAILRGELETQRAMFENSWTKMQDCINQIHSEFASMMGYAKPIVQFRNTNVLLTSDEIMPDSDSYAVVENVRKYLRNTGIDQNAYDILLVLDLDQDNSSGGWGDWQSRVAKVGWIYENSIELSDSNMFGLVYAAYQHEIGHIWGWEHNWGDDPSEVFITDPALFGWLDYDGDGIIEIEDPDPYR